MKQGTVKICECLSDKDILILFVYHMIAKPILTSFLLEYVIHVKKEVMYYLIKGNSQEIGGKEQLKHNGPNIALHVKLKSTNEVQMFISTYVSIPFFATSNASFHVQHFTNLILFPYPFFCWLNSFPY